VELNSVENLTPAHFKQVLTYLRLLNLPLGLLMNFGAGRCMRSCSWITTTNCWSRKWGEMAEGHGDWGRDGTLAVATRYLGWRLAEVVRQVRGLKYAAVAPGGGR
jgi:hypothetical protein